MQTASITHPHAQAAVLLASLNAADRDYVNTTLAMSGTPRRLYTLARMLRAVKLINDIEAMNAKPATLREAIERNHHDNTAALQARFAATADRLQATA